MILDDIYEMYPEGGFYTADGFDSAVIGIDPYKMLLIYSIEKCLEVLVEVQEMTPDDAVEYFEFNVAGSSLGDDSPIWLDDLG